MFTLTNNITIIIFTEIRDKGRIKLQTVPDFNIAFCEPISPSLSYMMSCELSKLLVSQALFGQLWLTLDQTCFFDSLWLCLWLTLSLSLSLIPAHSDSRWLSPAHMLLARNCVARSCVAPVYPALIYKTWYLLEKAKF